MKIQKEWRIREDLFLFKSPIGVKRKDMTFVKGNVFLPRIGNEAMPKWLEIPAETMCPVSNVTRHNCLSIKLWYNVTVKAFCLQAPLIVRGLMYSTPAKACENANMARSRPYMWNGYEQRRGNVGWSKGSLVHANGMIILGKSEVCTWNGHLTLIKGR